MISPPFYLGNHTALVKAFGYWPRFHDAPVIAFDFTKEGIGKVDLTLHGFETTSQTDERGYFKLIKHHVVRFAFSDISDAQLDQFIPENILFELQFSSAAEFVSDGKFKVTLDSAMGSDVGGSFVARVGEVLAVVPCDEKGRTIE